MENGPRESASRGPPRRVRRLPDDLRHPRRPHAARDRARRALPRAAARLAARLGSTSRSRRAPSRSRSHPGAVGAPAARYALAACSAAARSSPSSSGCCCAARRPLELCALYVWTGLLGTLAVLQFWMVLGELYTLEPGQAAVQAGVARAACSARRRRPLRRILSTRAPADHLVLASAVVLAVTALGPALALGRAEARRGAAAAGRRPRSARGCGCCAAIPTCGRSPCWCSSRRSP